MFEPVGRVLSNSQKSYFIEYVIAYPEKFRDALPSRREALGARHYFANSGEEFVVGFKGGDIWILRLYSVRGSEEESSTFTRSNHADIIITVACGNRLIAHALLKGIDGA